MNVLLKEKPDLIFLYYIIPKINGYELCGMLRKVHQFAELPIVILTAHHNLLEQFRGKISGCSNLIYEIIEADIFRRTISEYFDQPNTQQPSLPKKVTRDSSLDVPKSQPLYFSV